MRIELAFFVLLVLTVGCSEPRLEVTENESPDASGSDAGNDAGATVTPTPEDVASGEVSQNAQEGEDAGEEDAGENEDAGEDEQLPCDDKFSFSPDPLETGAINAVTYSHDQGFVYVGIEIDGPGDVVVGELEVSGNGPYYWTWEFTASEPGDYEFTFTRDEGEPQAMCVRNITDTGSPPELEPPPDEDCLCGQGDGCSECAVEGSCFDSPSDYHPDPGESGWQCNDVAGCTEGSCNIWCPYEPCPDGQSCPNNTENCWVDPSIDDYETACQGCCESYGAVWNSAGKYCAIP